MWSCHETLFGVTGISLLPNHSGVKSYQLFWTAMNSGTSLLRGSFTPSFASLRRKYVNSTAPVLVLKTEANHLKPQSMIHFESRKKKTIVLICQRDNSRVS
jgi:hypothetical protein